MLAVMFSAVSIQRFDSSAKAVVSFTARESRSLEMLTCGEKEDRVCRHSTRISKLKSHNYVVTPSLQSQDFKLLATVGCHYLIGWQNNDTQAVVMFASIQRLAHKIDRSIAQHGNQREAARGGT
jgi:hypothetical protein